MSLLLLLFKFNILGVRAWIITDQFCWIRLQFHLTKRGGGIKEREEGKRFWAGGGGDYFRYFVKGGDYLRKVITRGIANIRGNMVLLA